MEPASHRELMNAWLVVLLFFLGFKLVLDALAGFLQLPKGLAGAYWRRGRWRIKGFAQIQGFVFHADFGSRPDGCEHQYGSEERKDKSGRSRRKRDLPASGTSFNLGFCFP